MGLLIFLCQFVSQQLDWFCWFWLGSQVFGVLTGQLHFLSCYIWLILQQAAPGSLMWRQKVPRSEQEQGSWDLGVERAQCHFHYTLWAKASNKTSSNLKAEEIYWKYTLSLFYLFKILIVYLNFPTSSVLLFLKKNLFIYGCAGSWLLHRLFSSWAKQRLLSSCGVEASCCSDFSCGAGALGCARASALVAWELSSCSAQ